MEQFRNALVTKYYRNTDGIVFVFDLTRRETFDNLEKWVNEVKHYSTRGLESVKMILVGNKQDKVHQRKVSPSIFNRCKQVIDLGFKAVTSPFLFCRSQYSTYTQ